MTFDYLEVENEEIVWLASVIRYWWLVLLSLYLIPSRP